MKIWIMEFRMKTKIILIILSFIYVVSNAQNNNPYEEFGQKTNVVYESKVTEFLYIKNKDTLSQTKVIAFNFEKNVVLCFGKNDTILGEVKIEPEQLLHWLSIDPLANKYPGQSPYNFVINNPISAKDPDGKDVYLIIWATAEGSPGHAAIAVSNYMEVQTKVIENGKEITKTEQVPTGTFTYYDLWPNNVAVGKSNFEKDVNPLYQKFNVSWNNIFNQDPSKLKDKKIPDGIIKLNTNYDQDQIVTQALNKLVNANAPYNGKNNNCSDLAECGVETATGIKINADEQVKRSVTSTTPNSLFKATRKLPNTTVLRDPGSKVDNGFIEGDTGSFLGGTIQKVMGGEASPR